MEVSEFIHSLICLKRRCNFGIFTFVVDCKCSFFDGSERLRTDYECRVCVGRLCGSIAFGFLWVGPANSRIFAGCENVIRGVTVTCIESRLAFPFSAFLPCVVVPSFGVGGLVQ